MELEDTGDAFLDALREYRDGNTVGARHHVAGLGVSGPARSPYVGRPSTGG